MGEVTSLQKVREERNPHMTGVALCCACKHEWVATAPVGATFLDCPSCGTHKGRMVHPSLLEPGTDRLECRCGCQMFSVSKGQLVCVNCATKTPL